MGHSIGAIAKAIGRPKSTVSRELSRNKLPSGRYSPLHAAGAYQLRRRREALIERDRALRTFVVDRLAEGWAPEQISGWLKGGNEPRLRAVGCEMIYAFIYRTAQQAEQLWRYLTRRHRRRRPRRSRPSRVTIKDRVSIHERPKNVVRQVTAKNRYARALAAVTAWCRVNRHQSIPDQHAHLTAMMRGHYAYYGITGNFRRISWYARQVATIWQKWLSRRDRTRPGDKASQDFARALGAVWAGGSDERPPEALDAAIIFAPVGALVPAALAAVKKGGRVVCGGIHMSDIPSFPYRLLWQERQLVSVANLTRKDGHEFLGIAPRAGIKMQVTRYPLAQANTALNDLRAGRFEGAAVLIP